MRLEIGFYALLLSASLGAAYWASLPIKEGDEETVSLLMLEPKQVSEVSLVTKGLEVTGIKRAEDERFWFTSKKTEIIPGQTSTSTSISSATQSATATGTETSTDLASSPEAPTPPPAPEPKVKIERFLANEKFDEFLKSFSPLKASRVIGKVSDEQRKEYGFGEEVTIVTIKSGTQVSTLTLGKKSYGSRDRFALDGDRVILLDDQGFENLERADLRFYDRRILGLELDEVKKAEVFAQGKSKAMNHTQRNKNGELQWSDVTEGAAENVAYGSFMDKLGKLRISSYVSAEKEAELANAASFLEVSLEKDDKVLDRLVFKKLSDGNDKFEYFVTSQFMKAYGKVGNARIETLEKDIPGILGNP